MKTLLNLILIVFCQQSFAQNIVVKDTLPLVGYWHIGASKNVKNTKVTTKIDKGVKTTETITVNSIWKIKDSTEKHYIIHYTYKDFSFSNPKDSLNIAFAEVFKGVTIKYRTNELGIFDTILNLDEIIALSNKGIDNILKKLKWPDNAKTKDVMENLKNVLSNPVLLRNSISEDMVLIHYFYGLEYKLNMPYTYDSYMDNNLGGEPFPAKVVFRLTGINVANDRARFTSVTTPDPKEYKRIIYETMSDLAAQMQVSPPKKTDFETSSAFHKCEAETSIAEGWPLKVTFTKISTIRDNKSTEVTTITLTD